MGDARIDATAETAAKRVQAFLDGLADIDLLGDILFSIPGKQAPLITTDLVSLVESASECEKLRAALSDLVAAINAGLTFDSGDRGPGSAFGNAAVALSEFDAARALVGSAPPNESTKRFGLHCGECGAEVTGQNDEIVDVAASWSFAPGEGWRCPLHPLVGSGAIHPPPAHGEGWEFDDGG